MTFYSALLPKLVFISDFLLMEIGHRKHVKTLQMTQQADSIGICYYSLEYVWECVLYQNSKGTKLIKNRVAPEKISVYQSMNWQFFRFCSLDHMCILRCKIVEFCALIHKPTSYRWHVALLAIQSCKWVPSPSSLKTATAKSV